MMNHFRTSQDYELFLYTLPEQFTSIHRSTMTFVRRGASLARVAGELFFEHGFRLVARERLVSHPLPLQLEEYGYEIWQGDEKLYWYDSQPHPDEPDLQNTPPHHKHIPPDTKHSRIPAPQMRLTQPNFPVLMREIEELIADLEQAE